MNIESEPEVAPAPPEKPLSRSARIIEETKARHKAELDKQQAQLAMIYRMAAIIDSLPEDIAEKCHIFGDYLDFNGLSRQETLLVISMLNAGKWTKSVNGCDSETIDYVATIDGMKVRLWAAAPPDSCRVIEVEEEVPATKIVRRKLICSGPEI
jgi:hypothetical protein